MPYKRETAMNGMHMFRVFTRVVILAALVNIVCGDISYGQIAQTIVQRPKTAPIAINHQYMYLLRYQILLDKKADLLNQQGQTAQAAVLSGHLQKDLQFTDQQIAIVRDAGQQMQSGLAQIQAQAAPIIQQDRQWLTTNGRKAGPPPGAAQVHQLQQQRETLLANTVSQLNAQLNAQSGAKLSTYVSSHVVGQSLHIPSRRTKPGTVAKHLAVNQ